MKNKEELLYKTYDLLSAICWGTHSLEDAKEVVRADVMGYGTNIDEKIINYSGFQKLISDQREQGAGMEIRVQTTPVLRRILSGGNTAIFVDEVVFTFRLPNEIWNKLDLRVTWALEFLGDKWKLSHWHGSLPVAVEGDTWALSEMQQKNEELQRKVDAKTAELKRSLEDLKATQAQLIQSEKMASLGELTAGIAHEIQNPLNFVNNFSEVSTELIEEMKEELAVGNLQVAIDIANDLKQNLEKINHHGKRADGIVKSMLQHSRSSSGQKELTDINALCDEYLRLAYHGYRVKDKSSNAIAIGIETHLDPTLPKVSVLVQDIGRVILNLINNAFYAVSEKVKLQPQTSNFQPRVTVSTTNLGSKIEIHVQDNGPGIPDSIKEKIFQPFFTTKPTGQGTGLGLSLAYDIVTKGHSGELKLTTREGSGSEFIITLPT